MKSVSLLPMDDLHFEPYVQMAKQDYISELRRIHQMPLPAAASLTEQQFLDLLPNGWQTKGQHLFSIMDGDEHIGTVWYAAEVRSGESTAFIYDIRIRSEHRDSGYGSATMQALEAMVRSEGIFRMSLHVFGHNSIARQWYRKLGFVETDVLMSRFLKSD